MRSFIAIVPPSSAVEPLLAVCREIRSIAPSLRCQLAPKLHFTLEFLDDKEEAWLASCRDALKRIVSTMGPFPVALDIIGFFPGASSPRIIWAGTRTHENAPLCALAAAVKEECSRLGHAVDTKPFHPHITLSRVKTGLSPIEIENIAAIAFEPIGFVCSELIVMKSVLHQHGSVYERVYSIPLHGQGELTARPT